MKVVKVPIASSFSGYICRFCQGEVEEKAKQCPTCGIPYPSKEAQGGRLITRLVIGVILGLAIGWLLGYLAGAWYFQVCGGLLGIVAAVGLTATIFSYLELGVMIRALQQLDPNVIYDGPDVVAYRLGTPRVGLVRFILRRRHGIRS
jgi:hypothetical protein